MSAIHTVDILYLYSYCDFVVNSDKMSYSNNVSYYTFLTDGSNLS